MFFKINLSQEADHCRDTGQEIRSSHQDQARSMVQRSTLLDSGHNQVQVLSQPSGLHLVFWRSTRLVPDQICVWRLLKWQEVLCLRSPGPDQVWTRHSGIIWNNPGDWFGSTGGTSGLETGSRLSRVSVRIPDSGTWIHIHRVSGPGLSQATRSDVQVQNPVQNPVQCPVSRHLPGSDYFLRKD